ncbi:MAG: hypothetical protein QOC55_1113 [Thermoleophilaceae bacterium]|nr:hypothetical protein [Thermoleophilaceae bacterium]
MRWGRLASLTALLVALCATPAFAAHGAELSMMDDQALLGRSQAKVDSTLARMQALGVDRLRVSAFWSDIAPAAKSTARPAGFKPADPYDPAYDWSDLDRVVSSAAAHGIKVLVSISPPIPYWASSKPSLKNDVWEPQPAEFAQFAYAVALRYRASVDQFALLNEPNQGAWLQPQSQSGKAVAPHLYRALVQAGYPAIKAAAPGATVLVGELAPSGRNDPGVTRPTRPLAFLRAMGCRDARFRAIRTGRCKGFRPVPLDALGHHPYAIFQSPFQRSHYRDDAAMGDWRRLEQTLDRLVARKAFKPGHSGRVPIYYTEFGYQTDPPDPYAGVPLATQSRWLQDAAYVAWATPRVEGLNQFRLSDGAITGSSPVAFREFQSGLYFAGGKAKPSAATFPNPLVLRPAGRTRVLVWGQARPGTGHSVTIERRDRGAKSFRSVATVRADSRGYFAKRVARRTGSYYRFRWADPTGSGTSQALRVGR